MLRSLQMDVSCVQDAAIAHGYNNIHATVPQCVTAGQELPINELSELLRGEVQ